MSLARDFSVIQAATDPAAPARGTFQLEEGVLFRVWAPFAQAVSVVGSFNEWNPTAHPLEREADGSWRGVAPTAKHGDHYKFHVQPEQGEAFLRNDPYARLIDPETQNGVLFFSQFEWGDDGFQIPPLNEQVIYELHVGTFGGGATENKIGRFEHVRRMLPYLRNLGVNMIELMPPAQTPTEFSWGYNVNHPFAVETSYGGPDGLRALIKAAHEHGIGVIIDVVYNHFGPGDLDLWRFDGWSQNELGGIYFYNDQRAWTPWGDTRPDYGRAEVRQYIRDNALSWLREFHADGLRFDMTAYIRNVRASGDPADDLAEGWSLLQWVNDEVARYFPGKLTLAEDLHENEWLVKGTGAGGAGFHTQWCGAFVHPVRAALVASADEHRDLSSVVKALERRYDGDAFKRVVYSESHDEVANGRARIPYEVSADDPGGFFAQKRSTLGGGLVFTAPGVPMIFSGQEFLEDEWFRDTKPLDWTKREQFRGIVKLYRDLMNLRRNTRGTTRGLLGSHFDLLHLNQEAKVMSYLRRWDDSGEGDVLVIANFAHATHADYRLGVPRGGRWHVRFNSDSRLYSEDFLDEGDYFFEAEEIEADGRPASIRAGIGPYALMILSTESAAVPPASVATNS